MLLDLHVTNQTVWSHYCCARALWRRGLGGCRQDLLGDALEYRESILVSAVYTGVNGGTVTDVQGSFSEENVVTLVACEREKRGTVRVQQAMGNTDAV